MNNNTSKKLLSKQIWVPKPNQPQENITKTICTNGMNCTNNSCPRIHRHSTKLINYDVEPEYPKKQEELSKFEKMFNNMNNDEQASEIKDDVNIDEKNLNTSQKFIHSTQLQNNNICKFQLMGHCNRTNCKFRHLIENQLIDEIYGHDCPDKGNIIIMGQSPNPKKIISNNNININNVLKDNININNNYPIKADNKGWCYEGFHCNNINCKFKHRNLSAIDNDENRYRCLPSSIRGPRQHSKMSSANTMWNHNYQNFNNDHNINSEILNNNDQQIINNINKLFNNKNDNLNNTGNYFENMDNNRCMFNIYDTENNNKEQVANNSIYDIYSNNNYAPQNNNLHHQQNNFPYMENNQPDNNNEMKNAFNSEVIKNIIVKPSIVIKISPAGKNNKY